VIFYAIIQQAFYGRDDAESREMPWLLRAQISRFSSPHPRGAAIRSQLQIGGSAGGWPQ
jgi:hypothetical protein